VRWLLIHPGPSWSVSDVFNGWSEALTSLGEQVEEFPLDASLRFFNSALAETGQTLPCGCREVRKYLDRDQAARLAVDPILSAAHRFGPDVILCTSVFFIPPWLLEILRARRHKIVMLMTESPYQDGFQLKAAAYADLTLLNDPVNLAAYRQIGPAEYMPHAYRESVHHPAAPGTEPEYDLAFIGTGFPSRVKFFGQMDLAGLNVRLSGLWMDLPEDSPLRDWTSITGEADDCIDNTETAAIYRRSRTGINFYRVEAEAAHEGQGIACGPREIEMAACGLFFARDPRPESDELFSMLPSYTSPAEASGIIRWALAHPDERAEAADKARAAVAGRTFTEHAKQLLRLLDRQPVNM
jgi:spore maturation protein CgeB